jgi:transposase-like protein
MKSKTYEQTLKERVISDYLSGGGTYRQLSAKYGISFQLIHQWVQAFKGNGKSTVKKSHQADENSPENLPREVKQLQDELRQARLYNKLLEALVDIGKEQYGIDLRKKHGTKRS